MARVGVGVDFGTTNSVAAVYDGEHLSLLDLEAGGSVMPSATYIDQELQTKTGNLAIEQYIADNTGRTVELVPEVIGENSKFSDQIIESEYIDLDKNIYSRLYSFIGDSPANIQFYLTDMSNNFITGSLYFETKPNYDSLYPYINYIRNDIRKMVDSFEWTNE